MVMRSHGQHGTHSPTLQPASTALPTGTIAAALRTEERGSPTHAGGSPAPVPVTSPASPGPRKVAGIAASKAPLAAIEDYGDTAPARHLAVASPAMMHVQSAEAAAATQRPPRAVRSPPALAAASAAAGGAPATGEAAARDIVGEAGASAHRIHIHGVYAPNATTVTVTGLDLSNGGRKARARKAGSDSGQGDGDGLASSAASVASLGAPTGAGPAGRHALGTSASAPTTPSAPRSRSAGGGGASARGRGLVRGGEAAAGSIADTAVTPPSRSSSVSRSVTGGSTSRALVRNMMLGEGGRGSGGSVAGGSVATGMSRASRAAVEAFAAVLSPTRQRSTAPTRASNHRRILNALATVFFAGSTNIDRLKLLRRVVEDHSDRQLLLALASTGSRSNGSLVGIYAVIETDEEAAEAVQALHGHTAAAAAGGGGGGGGPLNAKAVLARRIFGTTCPPLLLPPMVHTLLKFDTAARTFRQIGFSCTFTVTTDAVGIETAHVHSAHGGMAAGGAVVGSSGGGIGRGDGPRGAGLGHDAADDDAE